MPELPEVECVRLGLAEVIGQKVLKVSTNYPALWGEGSLSPSCIKNEHLTAIQRKGKYLLATFEKHQLLLHLGMSGVWIWNQPLRPHTHFQLKFEKGDLNYSDPRKFGYLHLSKKGAPLDRWEGLGPDALDTAFNAKSWLAATIKSQSSLKALLLDQKKVAGVGNIYASEALWAAGLHPERPGHSQSLAEAQLLVKEVKRILRASIKNRGTTFSDYRLTNGKGGEFQRFLKVFQKEGEPCLNCQNPIQKKVQQNRSTFFCTECQK